MRASEGTRPGDLPKTPLWAACGVLSAGVPGGNVLERAGGVGATSVGAHRHLGYWERPSLLSFRLIIWHLQDQNSSFMTTAMLIRARANLLQKLSSEASTWQPCQEPADSVHQNQRTRSRACDEGVVCTHTHTHTHTQVLAPAHSIYTQVHRHESTHYTHRIT